MIDLIKRSTKETPLTWNDLDDNWAQIEDSLNALGNQQLYSIQDVKGMEADTIYIRSAWQY